MTYKFELDDISGIYLVDRFDKDILFIEGSPDSMVDSLRYGFGEDRAVGFLLDEKAIQRLYDDGYTIDGCNHSDFRSVEHFLDTIGIERR